MTMQFWVMQCSNPRLLASKPRLFVSAAARWGTRDAVSEERLELRFDSPHWISVRVASPLAGQLI